MKFDLLKLSSTSLQAMMDSLYFDNIFPWMQSFDGSAPHARHPLLHNWTERNSDENIENKFLRTCYNQDVCRPV